MTMLVQPVVALGMLWVVPFGLRLAGASGRSALVPAARAWPLCAAPAAIALWLPRGALAATLVLPYAAAASALAGYAAVHAARALRRSGAAEGPARGTLGSTTAALVALTTALCSPAVAAVALVAERTGRELFGFDLDVLTLTVAHFHYAGFAAALIAGLVCRTAPGPLARFAAYSVPTGTLLVLIGYFVGDWAELVGAAVLTAGMWSVALVTWRELRGRGEERATRMLLTVSTTVLAATMVLALSWAVGEATAIPHPSAAWMAATHGLGNALGFALCSLLAWRRLHTSDIPDRTESPVRPLTPKETTT
ncbi:YndJ family protein [Streptomyces sp. NPDC006879]|uniref:YndJ family protein n=1 Tax=Streptomyces sp. NPDC006879 TaxID=3364767 RepID=UPI0036A34A04